MKKLLKNDKVLSSEVYNLSRLYHQEIAPSKVPPKLTVFTNHGKFINSPIAFNFHKFGGSFDGGSAVNAFLGILLAYPKGGQVLRSFDTWRLWGINFHYAVAGCCMRRIEGVNSSSGLSPHIRLV